jgi:hypothetical protein
VSKLLIIYGLNYYANSPCNVTLRKLAGVAVRVIVQGKGPLGEYMAQQSGRL